MIDLGTVVFGGSVVSGLAGATVERADVGTNAGVIVPVGNLAYSRLQSESTRPDRCDFRVY